MELMNLMVNDACVKLNPININILLSLNLKNLPNFCITMKRAVYEAPLVCTVVNQRNSILLQLLCIQYFHFAD